MKTDRQTITQSEYHLQTYNTHTIIKGPPTPYPKPTGSTTHQLTTFIQNKGTPHPLPPTHRKYHPPTYNTHTLIKGPPNHTPYPQPTGNTIHQLTMVIHNKETPHPLSPNHRKYHPPNYNSYTKGTPHPPTPNPQGVPPTILQHTYTEGTHHPPYPQPTESTTHHLTILIHPQSYNTHTLKGPPSPTPNPQEVPPTILQHSYTHNLTTLIH